MVSLLAAVLAGVQLSVLLRTHTLGRALGADQEAELAGGRAHDSTHERHPIGLVRRVPILHAALSTRIHRAHGRRYR